MSEATSYPWRILLVLWLAALVVTPMIWPYSNGLLAIAPHPPDLPENIGMLLLLRNMILATVMIPAGLFFAGRLGLAAPYLDAWLYRRGKPEPGKRLLIRSTGWALAISAVIFAIDVVFLLLGATHPAPEIHARIPGVEAWRGIPLSFYASVIEELAYRLFLLSALAWIVITLTRARGPTGRAIGFWIANGLAAIAFGAYHLSGIEMFGPPSDLVILRTYLILLVPGLVFGYLFWKRGLETAIACHFLVDIVVHVIRPLIDPGA